MSRFASGRRRAALVRRTAALLGGVALAATAVVTASAHAVEHAGPYTVAIGWATEPAYVGSDNAAEAIVTDQAGKPVDDLQPGDLKVQVSIGGSRTGTKDMEPGFDADTGLGTPGEYNLPLIPTAPGAYTFHVTGSIHGTAVDKTVTASDQTFAVVTEPTDDQFPAKVPSSAAVSTKVDQITARVTAARKAADDASSGATRALIVGIVALVAGVALGGAGTALAARRRGA